jgi:hypothetical protein
VRPLIPEIDVVVGQSAGDGFRSRHFLEQR